MASPSITFANGQVTTTTSEQDLFAPVIADKYYKVYVNLKNVQSGDTMVIRSYIWDEFLGEYMCIGKITATNAQDPVAVTLGFDVGTRFKVTIQKTVGTNRTVTWLRGDV